jgi:CrcB protein
MATVNCHRLLRRAHDLSTFSAEVVTLLQPGRLTWAVASIATHVSGSLLMTLAGLASWQWLPPR